jgi:hypothetical protein
MRSAVGRKVRPKQEPKVRLEVVVTQSLYDLIVSDLERQQRVIPGLSMSAHLRALWTRGLGEPCKAG